MTRERSERREAQSDENDRRLPKVAALCVAVFGGIVVAVQTPMFEFGGAFGGGPTGTALAVLAVLAGIAGWVALEAATEDAFSD
ncbi:hypothetical protein BRC67_07680 [Halobacteriales archaeon QH_3_68_24]|nr:MAG: hypothetical protein BRC67_07680 [Halobacteriales archaeon QH_3_68_24]